MLNIANVITAIRLFGSLIVLLYVAAHWPFESMEKGFKVLLAFLLLGSTDLVDGWVARATGNITDFGKRFDPIADFVYCTSLFMSHQVIWWGTPISYLGWAFVLYFALYASSVVNFRKMGALGAPDFLAKAAMFALMTGLVIAFASSLFAYLRSIGHVVAILFILGAVLLTSRSLDKIEKKSRPRP